MCAAGHIQPPLPGKPWVNVNSMCEGVKDGRAPVFIECNGPVGVAWVHLLSATAAAIGVARYGVLWHNEISRRPGAVDGCFIISCGGRGWVSYNFLYV